MTAVALAGNALPAFAAPYLVDTSADVHTQNKTTLREAVSQANLSPDNFVEFAPALNGSTITLTQGEIPVNQPMTIVGPGADKLTISGNNMSRIFNISTASNTPIAVTLSGLTLSHGHAGNSFLGGAIYTSNVSLTVLDAALEYNNALQGGAIFLHSGGGVASATKLMRTTVANNSTDQNLGQGGGIFAQGGAMLQIVDSIISANTSGEAGGGTFYNVGATTIETSRITGNHAAGSLGGGLFFFNSPNSVATSSVTIDNSTISGNTSALNGGGLQLTNVVAVLTGDTISGNSASAAGGGVFVFDSTSPKVTQLTLQQSSVTGNTAYTFGGGIDANAALSVTVSRSLISGNNVYNQVGGGGGGGIALEYVNTQSNINDSTIYANYAYNNGGGVGIFGASDATVFNGATIANNFTFNYASNGILAAGFATELYNCVVANNFSHTSNQDIAGSVAEYYSLIRNVGTATVSGNHNKNGQNPLLGPLAVNGGPTLTMMPTLSSPLLDAGGPLLTGTDQRGLPRSANGRRDIGAVERQNPEDVIFRNGFDTLFPG